MGGNSSKSPLPTSVTSGTMLQQNQGAEINNSGAESKLKKKICCACPETKRLRDECIVLHGEDACAKLIEAHKMCLRSEGFDV